MYNKLEVKNLNKTYFSKKGNNTTALRDVNIVFPEKGLVFITGKSGSGKSTLLNVLGGLDTFDSGEIIINGTSSKSFSQRDFDAYRNTYLGFIFQEYNILEEFSVYENISIALELQKDKYDKNRVEEILKKVDLEGFGSRKPAELSGGQKQRIAIARALIKNPDIIFADEPTGALDTKTGEQILYLLKELSKEKLVIIVSHDMELTRRYADRIIEFKDGSIISDNMKDTSNNFVETTEVEFNSKTDSKFKLIKSSLSNKHAFKIGSNSLKTKPMRLVLTVFLAVVSFALFGLSNTLGNYDINKATVESMRDFSVNISGITKDEVIYDEDREIFTGVNMTINDYNKLIADYNVELYKVLDKMMLFRDSLGELDDNNYYLGSPSDITGVINVNENDLRELGYGLTGKLPTGLNEIVISEYLFEYFVEYGLRISNVDGSESIIEIKSKDDLIGQTIILTDAIEDIDENVVITGIVDTNINSKYKEFGDLTQDYVVYDEFNAYRKHGFHANILISNEKMNQYIAEMETDEVYSSFLFQTPENDKLLNIVNNVNLIENDVTYRINNRIINSINSASLFVENLIPLAFISAVVSAVFSALLIFNFISISVSYKKKEIGILRAIGARSNDVNKIFFYETLLIGLIIFIISSLSLTVIVNIINDYLKSDAYGLQLTVLILSIKQHLLLFGLSILITTISGFLPVRKIAMQKPIESIKKY